MTTETRASGPGLQLTSLPCAGLQQPFYLNSARRHAGTLQHHNLKLTSRQMVGPILSEVGNQPRKNTNTSDLERSHSSFAAKGLELHVFTVFNKI